MGNLKKVMEKTFEVSELDYLKSLIEGLSKEEIRVVGPRLVVINNDGDQFIGNVGELGFEINESNFIFKSGIVGLKSIFRVYLQECKMNYRFYLRGKEK